jgi:hypothetical protein
MSLDASRDAIKTGLSSYLHRPLLAWIVGIVAIAIIASQIISLARQKPFWFDEAYEVLETCTRPYSQIIIAGPLGQCSAAPLYYLIQKAVVGSAGMSGNILMTYRLVSISAAILMLIVLFFAFSRYFGVSIGLLALMVVAWRPDFLQFAAENRPYMLWVFLFTVVLLLVSSMVYRQWETLRPVSKAGLGLLMLALTLVSGAGLFQAILFAAAFSLWHHPMDFRGWMRRPVFLFQLPIVLLCGGVGAFYALKSCLTYSGGTWDLLATGNWQLVWDVLDLLYPLRLSSCRDRSNPCGLVTLTVNVFVAAAVVILPLWWKRRMTLSEPAKFALSISLVSIVQLLCAVFVGVLVARAHYYFVPRVFLYLISLRAVLAAAGAYLCMSIILELARARFRGLPQSVLHWLIFAAVLGVMMVTYMGNRSVIWVGNVEEIHLADNQCPPARSSVGLLDTQAPKFTASQKTYEHEEHKLNFIFAFSRHLSACGWKQAEEPVVYVVPRYESGGLIFGYEMRETIEAGAPIIGFFGEPVLPREKP